MRRGGRRGEGWVWIGEESSVVFGKLNFEIFEGD